MEKLDKIKVKKILKDVWHFIWESNSIWSWIVNVILAFILIKFIVYPGLGLAFSTSYPIVAVVSGSMEHDGNFDNWWSSDAICGESDCAQADYYRAYNMTKEEFLDLRYKNGFNKGDIMILYGSKPENINVGDVIVFRSTRPDPIIHRVIYRWESGGKYYFQTKGDHNSESYQALGEDKIVQDRILGKAVVRVPYLGWVKIAFVNIWSFAMPR